MTETTEPKSVYGRVAELKRQGMVYAETVLISERVEGGLAHVSTEIIYLAEDRRRIGSSQLSYVLQKDGHSWKILVVMIDKSHQMAPGVCILEQEAA